MTDEIGGICRRSCQYTHSDDKRTNPQSGRPWAVMVEAEDRRLRGVGIVPMPNHGHRGVSLSMVGPPTLGSDPLGTAGWGPTGSPGALGCLPIADTPPGESILGPGPVNQANSSLNGHLWAPAPLVPGGVRPSSVPTAPPRGEIHKKEPGPHFSSGG